MMYSEVRGQGKPVVMLHGWGMHSGIWGTFAEQLAAQHELHLIDLPGYGHAAKSDSDHSLSAYRQQLKAYLQQLNRPVTLLGWSMGGLISLDLIQHEQKQVEKLILIASTPCFTRKPDWHSAMAESVFDQFAEALIMDQQKTLQRFLALQTRGSDMSKDELRQLQQCLRQRGEASAEALQAGLMILKQTDLRQGQQSELPLLLVAGEKDTLIPLTAMEAYRPLFSSMQQVVIRGAGHAPFVSQPQICAEHARRFINE